MTRTLAAHVRQERAADREKAENIGAEHGLDFSRARFFDRGEHAKAGVIDEDIDAAETFDRSLGGSLSLRLVVDVEFARQQIGMIAEAVGYGLGISRRRDDGVAFGEGFFYDQSAETARFAGDDSGTHDATPKIGRAAGRERGG